MAGCGCQQACGCTVIGDGVTTTAVTIGDTTTVSAIQTFLGVSDTNCIDMVLAAGIVSANLLSLSSNSIALACVPGGLQATLRLDPASTAPVSITAAGLRVDCCAATPPAIKPATPTVVLSVPAGILQADVIPNILAGVENQAGGVSIKLEDDPAAVAAAAGTNLARFTAAGDLTVQGSVVAGFVGMHARSVTAGAAVNLSNTVGVQSGNSFSAVITNPTTVAMMVRLEGIAHLESVSSGVVGTNRMWNPMAVLDITVLAGGALDIGSNGLYAVAEWNSNVIAAGATRIDRGHIAKWAYIPPGGSVTFTSFMTPLIVSGGWTTTVGAGGFYQFENIELAIFPAKTGGWAL